MLSLFITFDATPLDPPSINEFSWGFHKLDEMAMIPILEPEALLCETKKNSVTKCYPLADLGGGAPGACPPICLAS